MENEKPTYAELEQELERTKARLRHLLTSKTIQLFDEVDPRTGEYVRRIGRLDSYGVKDRLLHFERTGEVISLTATAKQVKTIIIPTIDRERFDTEVNAALRDGWALIKCELLLPVKIGDTHYLRSLYAELEKSVPVKVPNPDAPAGESSQ